MSDLFIQALCIMIPTNKYTEFFSHYIKGTNNTLRVCVCVCVCVCVKLLQLYLIL